MSKKYTFNSRFFYFFILFILTSNIYGQLATLDASGNYKVTGTSSLWWDYQYKPTGSSTYTQSTIQQSTSYSLVKLNPFISWDFRIRYYNYNGQPGTWSSDYTVNANYSTISKSVGYSFNFDTPVIDEGWRGYRLQNTTSDYNSNIIEVNYIFNGTTGKSVYLGWQSGNGVMLVSPKITDLSTDKKFSFYANSYQGSYSVIVGTMSNPYDMNTFHPLKTVDLANGGFNKIDVFLNNYTSSDQYIAIKSNGNNGDIYFDDFSYEQSVNCFDLTNVAVNTISEHNATISYTSSSSSSFEISLKNLRTGITKIYTTTNSSSFEMTDLVGATNYEIKIRGNCDAGLFTNWSPIKTFTTPCDGVSNGYYTTFGEENSIDPCWSKIVNYTTINNISMYNYGSNLNLMPKSGTKLIQISASNSESQKGYLISPYVSDLDNNKRIKFYLTSSSGDYIDSDITVGTMSNPTDETTFVPIKTITPSEINQINGYKVNNYLKEHIIYFNNYNTSLNHHYIALKVGNSPNSYYDIRFFIDDFRYENIPSCKEPTDLKCLRNEVENVVLKWNDFDSSATEWELEYGLKGFAIGNGTRVTVNSNPYTLTANLLDKVDYEFYVRTKCGSQYSNWSDVGIFKSKCNAVNVGYVGDFENEGFEINQNTCWSRITPDIRESFYKPDAFVRYQTAQSSNGVLPKSGTSMMEIFSHRMYSDNLVNEKTILVSPKLDGLNSEKKISFWAHVGDDAYSTITRIEVGTLSDIQDYTTFIPYEIIDTDILRNQWKEYTVDFSRYRGTNQYVGIRVFGTNSSNLRVFVDDFKYLQNDCSRPSDLTASQKSDSSVELNWNTNNNNSINCEIEYGYKGFTPGSGTIITSTTVPLIIDNLSSNSEYEFRVRNICGNPTINWSLKYPFKISCSVNTPFEENFDSYPATNAQYIPDFCWTTNENPNENIWFHTKEYFFNNFNSSPNALSMQISNDNKEAYLITPYLRDFNNTKKVKFWLSNPLLYHGYNQADNNSQVLTIGLMSNPTDLSTYEVYQEIQITDVPVYGKEFDVNFSDYTGSKKFIAFRLGGNNISNKQVYIDDFKYLNNEDCKEPINIQFLNISNNSALIKWDDTVGQNVEIEYGTTGFTPGTGNIVNSSSNQIQINSLNESTTYDFYFKTKCTPTTSSINIKKSITTTCNLFPIPWLEDFKGLPEYGNEVELNCFKHVYGTYDVKNAQQIIYGNSYGSDHLLNGFDDSTYMHINGSFSTQLLTPTFHLEAGTTYKFSLQARKSYEYAYMGIDLHVGRGQEPHYMEAYLGHNKDLTEYNYNQLFYYYTPIVSGDYNYLLDFRYSGAANMIVDNLELNEGYSNVISNNTDVFDFQNGEDSKIIIEGTNSSKAQIVTDFNDNSNKYVSLLGSENSIEWKSTTNDIWSQNQNNISKVNFKINGGTQNKISGLYLLFDLKQTFNDSNNESMFRVLVNGNIVGNIIRPSSNNSDMMQTYQFDLSPYLGGDIKISLQHIGKFSGNIGDNAYLDNIKFSPTALLSTNENSFVGFSYYPNPTSNVITIDNSEEINFIELSSLTGQIIYSQKNNSNKMTIDMSNYARGVYFLKVNSNGKSKTVKIIRN